MDSGIGAAGHAAVAAGATAAPAAAAGHLGTSAAATLHKRVAAGPLQAEHHWSSACRVAGWRQQGSSALCSSAAEVARRQHSGCSR